MKVADAMTRDVVTIGEDTPFKEIAETLIEHRISAVPVIDPEGNVAGVVTEADLVAKEAYPGHPRRGFRAVLADIVAGQNREWIYKSEATKAWDVMTPNVVSVSPDDDLHTASRRMLEEKVKRLVVLDADGRIAGIISRSDIVRVLAAGDAEIKDRVERLLLRAGFVPPDTVIAVDVSDGVATLEGTVLYESDIHIATAMVEAVDGVIAVDNRLLYRHPESDRGTIRVSVHEP